MYLEVTLRKIIYAYNKEDTIIANVQISYDFFGFLLFCRDHVQRCVSFLGHLAQGQEYKEVYLEGVYSLIFIYTLTFTFHHHILVSCV